MILEQLRNWWARIPGRPSRELRLILAELESNRGHFPAAAVAAAVAQREEITPHLLNIIRETTRNAKVLAKKDYYFAHIFAMFLLAQFREKRAYPLLVEFLRLPGTLTEDLLGDMLTEDADRLLASVCGGDPALIERLVEDSRVNEWARSAGIECFNIMVFNGLLPREKAVAYFRHLFCGGLERKGSNVWNVLVSCAADLHPAEVMDEIRRAYTDGLVEDGFVGLDEIEDELRRDRDSIMAEHKNLDRGLIVDVVADMSRWHCFESKDDGQQVWDEDDDALLDDRDRDDEPPAEDDPRQTVERPTPKTGRNEPCPCGSGKKYKKCCGR
jgi:hypothetical protein